LGYHLPGVVVEYHRSAQVVMVQSSVTGMAVHSSQQQQQVKN
jgi:hypothetical protein